MEVTQVSVVSIPMRNKFRGLTSREMLIFRGSQRFAEWSPFLEYEDQEASLWLQSALEWANAPLPTTFRNTVKTNATLPAVSSDLIPEILSRFEGFDTVKIKVSEPGQSIADDLARVRFVAENYPGVKIRLDANGGFSVDQAMEICMAASNLNIEYFEQPCQTVSELAELKKRLEHAGLEIKIADKLLIPLQPSLFDIQASRAHAEGLQQIGILTGEELDGIKRFTPYSNGGAGITNGAATELDKMDHPNWPAGYGGLLLAEYYLATGDILPEPGVAEVRDVLLGHLGSGHMGINQNMGRAVVIQNPLIDGT